MARVTDRQAEPQNSLAAEASQWAILLTDDPDDKTLREEFSAWHARSPAHAEAWTATLRIWSLTGTIGPELLSLPASHDNAVSSPTSRQPSGGEPPSSSPPCSAAPPGCSSPR
ncbi:FecR/PupR family sigma factor regulator [Acetobacter oeni]|uniref:FecR/PupR family sigma factor regulator n=1 Tax=Acetobacter oeni TaxID=304077 RepID=UPI0015696324|nr:DUF4880 domain-containing protein [Acetobacter oeni]MBB3881929.1 ferric-dicitrate binding protein FerR (iron transport regulator) [Acetobacter oeni]